MLKNSSGTILIDYITFVAAPEVLKTTYVCDGNEMELNANALIPANTEKINLYLSQPLFGHGLRWAINELGEYADTTTAFDHQTNVYTININGELTKSATYDYTGYVTTAPDLEKALDMYNYFTMSKYFNFNISTELEPVRAEITKQDTSAIVDYVNESDDKAVLVAVATGWDGNKYVGKVMETSLVEAGDTANVNVDYASLAGSNIEIVVWRYDVISGTYSVLSRAIK